MPSGRAFRLAGGGGLRATGGAAPGGRYGRAGGLAALAEVAARARHDPRDRCEPHRHPRGALRPDCRQSGPAAVGANRAHRPRPPPRLRRGQHPRAAGLHVLRCAPHGEPRAACGRPQSHPDRPRARLHAARCAGLRPRPRALSRRRAALCGVAPCDRAAREGMAGGKLDRARHAACARRLRSRVALGLARREGAGRSHGGIAAARACQSASLSTVSRG